MGAKMSIRGIDAAFRDLRRKQETAIKVKDRIRNQALLVELKEETPVDTGEARDSWKRIEVGTVTNIINITDYIEFLNQGSSKQAPAYFIERIALKYGKPLGSIVTVIDN